MRIKFLFILMLLSIAAFAQQNPIQIDANGLTQTLTAGGVVTRGQIVKINSAGQVIPMLTTDTSGAIGIAATSQTSAGNGVQVSIGGTPLVQIDSGGCSAGNVISISSITGGAGHCAATASGQQIGIAVSISSPGSNFWNAQLSPNSAGSAGSGVEGSSVTGVFTSAQMNQPALFTLNGGGICNPFNIVNLGGVGTSALTDAWSACVNLPTTGVTNGFSNGFGSYLKNNNSNNAGQFGWTGAVGYYSQVWCQAGTTNNRCWGANFSTSDTGAASGGVIYGTEFDVTPCCTTTTGAGLLMSMRGTNQITGDNYPAIQLQSSGTGNFWTSGLQCGTSTLSSVATNPFTCVEMGKQSTGNVDSSQIHFTATGATGAVRLLQDNYMLLDITPAWTVHNPTGREQLGVALTATATLAVNTLVKVDTANADSVVVCTTADTHCIGFVVGGSVYCAAGGTHCGINTIPGSKAQGILGTGTCAIGNFVIVDTTTNGRIKCQAGIPAQGAYIGDAISAQVTVGNLVDILTKFQ